MLLYLNKKLRLNKYFKFLHYNNMSSSTPINQLPQGQPIANDPVLVQQILKEAMGQQPIQPQQQPQPIHQAPIPPPMLSPSYYPKPASTMEMDYGNMLKGFILVAVLVFISQMPSLKEYIGTYIPQHDLNLIVRAVLAGASYVGLEMLF